MSFAEPRLPQFKNDRERIAYLVYLRQVIPNIFQESARYGGDLFEQIVHQEKIEKMLEKNPEYQKLIEGASWDLLQLDVKVEGSATITARVLDAGALKKWQSQLVDIISGIPDGTDPSTYLNAEIKKRLGEIGAGNSDSLRGTLVSFATGDADLADPDKRKNMTTAEIYTRLSKPGVLPEELTAKGFRPEVFGLPSGPVSRETALKLLETLPQRERELVALVQTHLLLQNNNGKLPDAEEIVPTLRRVGEGEIDTFVDHSIYTKKLGHLATAIGVSPDELALKVGGPTRRTRGKPARGSRPAIAPKTISSGIMHRAIKELSSQRTEVKQSLTGALTLYEVPAQVSIFRGCVGGDCSTTNSGDVPNAPMERVFFVQDARGLKGQISTTVVELENGEKALFVHTIAGKRVSTADTVTILQALYSSRETLGVSEIVLIHADKVGGNNNYQSVRDGFRLARQEMEVVPIKYLDGEVRKKLKAASYDGPGVHTHGHLYRPTKVAGADLKVTPKTHTLPEFENSPVTRLDVILFAIDLDNLGEDNESNVRRVLRSLDRGERITHGQFLRIRHALRNKKRLSLPDFYANVASVLQPLGVQVDDAFVEDRSYYFWNGHLASRDVRDPKRFAKLPEEQQKRTVEFVLAELTDQSEVPKEVAAVIKANIEYFSNSEKFLNYLQKIARADPPDTDDLKQLSEIMKLGIAHESLGRRFITLIAVANGTDEKHAKHAQSIISRVAHWEPAQVKEIAKGLHSDDFEIVKRTLDLLKKIEINEGSIQVRLLQLEHENPFDQRFWTSPVSLLEKTPFTEEAANWVFNKLQTASESDRGQYLELLKEHRTENPQHVLWIVNKLLSEVDPSARRQAYGWGPIHDLAEAVKAQSPEAQRLGLLKLQLWLAPGQSLENQNRALQVIVAMGPKSEKLALFVLDRLLDPTREKTQYDQFEGPRLPLDALLEMDPKEASIHERLAKEITDRDAGDAIRMRAIQTLEELKSANAKAHEALLIAWLAVDPESDEFRRLTEALKDVTDLSIERQRRIANELQGDSNRQSAAASILASHKANDPAIQLKLASKLVEPGRSSAKETALRALKAHPEAPLAVILKLGKGLENNDPEAKVGATKGLAHFGTDRKEILEDLTKLALESGNSNLRTQSRAALAKAADLPTTTWTSLLRKLRSNDATEQQRAIEIVGELSSHNRNAVRALIAIATNTSLAEEQRTYALSALRNYAKPKKGEFYGRLTLQDYQDLKPLTEGEDNRVRRSARSLFSEARSDSAEAQLLFMQLYQAGSRESRRDGPRLTHLADMKPSAPAVLLPLIRELRETAKGDRYNLIRFFSSLWQTSEDDKRVVPRHPEVMRALALAMKDLTEHERSSLWDIFAHPTVTDVQTHRTLAEIARDPEAESSDKRGLLELVLTQKRPSAELVNATFLMFGEKPDWNVNDPLFKALEHMANSDLSLKQRLAREALSAPKDNAEKAIEIVAGIGVNDAATISALSAFAKREDNAAEKAFKVLKTNFLNTDDVRYAVAMVGFRHNSEVEREFGKVFGKDHYYESEFYMEVAKELLREAKASGSFSPTSAQFFLAMLKDAEQDHIEMRRYIGKLIRSEDPLERAVGLFLLSGIQTRSRGLRNTLFDLAEHEDATVREYALFALANQEGLKRDRVAALIERAHEREDRAADELFKANARRLAAGESTRTSLAAQLEHGDEDAREKALDLLEKIGTGLTEEQLLKVIEVLKDGAKHNQLAGKAYQILIKFMGNYPDAVVRRLLEMHEKGEVTEVFKQVIPTLLSQATNPIPELAAFHRKQVLDKSLDHNQRNQAIYGLEKVIHLVSGIHKEIAPELKADEVENRWLAARVILLVPETDAEAMKLKREALTVIEAVFDDPKIKEFPIGADRTMDRRDEVVYTVGLGVKAFPDEVKKYVAWFEGDDVEKKGYAAIIIAEAGKDAPVPAGTREKVAAWLAESALPAVAGNMHAYPLAKISDVWPEGTLEKVLEGLKSADPHEVYTSAMILKEAAPKDATTKSALLGALRNMLADREENMEWAQKEVAAALKANSTPEEVAEEEGRIGKILRRAGVDCSQNYEGVSGD